ncbi:MAG TPA: anthranilate synthase component I family protein [Candidatus Binatia bacterium]|jgi:para-aminobenzoate synthetase component 1|nr:anthranilate synthase component I family protein [Candidatus Binatia bacterium]
MPLVPLALRRDPLDVLASLASEPGAVLLAVPDPTHPVTLLGAHPVAELCIAEGDDDPFTAIARFVADTPVDPDLPFPLAGGVVAALAYELGSGQAPHAARHPSDAPIAVLRRYDPLLVWDHRRMQYALLTTDPSRPRPSWLERVAMPVDPWTGALGGAPLAATVPPERYLAAARRILDYLAAGDAYQVNLTQPFAAPLAGPAHALFARLCRLHPVPRAAYLDLGAAQLVGNSPELLLRRRGRRVETHPIKGTRPRGADPARDAALIAELRRDPKENAEHVMIVDLERNDLGRVCAPGSVTVQALADVESHATVHHLVSRVSGSLRADTGLADVLAAIFPGGSITGAPKIRAMEIIAELEDGPRGVYTGALGLLDPRGDVELALPIRTGVVRDGVVRWHAGGGIVADSSPERELAEAWLKTAALRLALGERLHPELEQCSSG